MDRNPRLKISRVCVTMITSFVIAVWLTGPVFGQELSESPISLPQPTGVFGVSTSVWHWSGYEANAPESALEVVAQLWYPANIHGTLSARYRPLGGAEFRRVRQHAVGAAPFAENAAMAPVIVICPGRGTNRYNYSSIAEDLASRGFAVFAVDIPYIGYVEFPDGRIVEPSDSYRPSFELITGPYELVDKFFEPAVRIGLSHLEFALNNLEAVNNNDPAGMLTGRLDLEKIGAFGHSLGGRICGALTESNSNVIALATMEGIPPRDTRLSGMSASSLMLYSSDLPEDMALPNIMEVFDNRRAESTILRLDGFGHNSVTDRPLFFPDDYKYQVNAICGLEITRQILASFFEAHLAKGRFLPAEFSKLPEVTVIRTSIRP